MAQVHGDWLYLDAALALRETAEGRDTSQFARRMLWVSPHCPRHRAALIRHDPAVPAEWVTAWEAESQHPEIFEALADRAIRAGKWEDAQRDFQRALELSPDLGLYRLLAEGYKTRGQTDKWVAALEEFLKSDDTGLDHALVRVELANHFLAKKEYRRAQGHAETAAESGAAPALQCAARCAEAMDEWPKAEGHVRRLSEQFPDLVVIWMLWCHRTGRGDATAAAKLVEERLGQVKGEPTPSELVSAAVFRALTGRPDLAPDLLLVAHRRKRDDGALLLAASLSDTQQDVGSRERFLNEIPIASPYLPAKSLLASARNESEEFVPTEEAMDSTVKRTAKAGRGLVCYVLGMYALRRGDDKRATEYLKRSIDEADPKDTASAALSAIALRSMTKK